MNTYQPSGVCSKEITFDVHDGILRNVNFVNGCPGNLQAISKLVEGMPVSEVIDRLKGIKCGVKSTSCGDQLAKALEESLK